MVFATAADLIAAYDVAILGDLTADTDVATPPNQIQFSPYCVSAIARASADIRMAAQQGERYSDEDLLALYNEVSDTSLRMQIVGLCVDRAFGYLINRRALKAEQYKAIAVRAVMTDQILEMLMRGQRIFTLPAQELAGAEVAVTSMRQTACNSIVVSLPRFFPSILPDVNSLNGGGGCCPR